VNNNETTAKADKIDFSLELAILRSLHKQGLITSKELLKSENELDKLMNTSKTKVA